MISDLTLPDYYIILDTLKKNKDNYDNPQKIEEYIKELEKFIEWSEIENANPKPKYQFLDKIRTFEGEEGDVLDVEFSQKNPPKYIYLISFGNLGKYIEEEKIKEIIGRNKI